MSKEQRLRQQLEWITARHDSGAMSPAVVATVKAIQIEIGWLQHAETANLIPTLPRGRK